MMVLKSIINMILPFIKIELNRDSVDVTASLNHTFKHFAWLTMAGVIMTAFNSIAVTK